MKNFRWIAMAALMMAVMLVPAQANIVVLLNSVTGPSGGQFTWSYEASLQVGEELNPGDVAITGFFTIYDISGLVLGSETQPLNWTPSEQATGITPAGLSPTDTAAPNITWTYSGPAITPTVIDADLGTFTFKSTMGNNGLLIAYTQQAVKNNPGHTDDDTRDAGFGSVVGPSASVPEPTSIILLGSVLALIGSRMRRRFVQGQ
jgi:hypothetical protein